LSLAAVFLCGERMITLRIEASFNNKMFRFEKAAGELPTGINWHKGLWVDVGLFDALIVEAVYVRGDNGCVVFEEEYTSEFDDEDKSAYEDAGFVLIKGSGFFSESN
jgi:hypothetical protein